LGLENSVGAGLGGSRLNLTRGSRPELYDLAPLGLIYRDNGGHTSYAHTLGSRPELYDLAPLGLIIGLAVLYGACHTGRDGTLVHARFSSKNRRS
jgi:hypothetical protein